MRDAAVSGHRPHNESFRHEALLYAGQSGFVSGTLPFIRDGLASEEAMLVVVSQEKIDLLRHGLGSDADAVHFADMAEVGMNPARIIPAWYDFVNEYRGRRLRGIGEPIWASRSSAELIECQRHESLLNVAFAEAPAWWLLCPYDTESLDPGVIAEARRSHSRRRAILCRRRVIRQNRQESSLAREDGDAPALGNECARRFPDRDSSLW